MSASELLVRGATILEADGPLRVADIRAEGGTITAVGPGLRPGSARVIDADGAASNDNQNMFEAMKFTSLIQTLHGSHLRWPQPHAIWRMCLRGGAAALGQPLGSLRPGSAADIVLLSTERHVPVHAEGLAASLVLAEHGESAHTVIVDGEVVVSEGRSARVGDAAMAERSRDLQQRIHESLPERQAFYDRYVDVLTEVHDHAMAQPAPVQRLAEITPAFGTADG